ncbi:hypothetical protein [Nocardia puris]|uniref:Uncharacterized protein n=1 Tax=Nocardia puris TaxID=208602 RepID=A0A366DN46_9NOCA|nr:hypothetical protein [Nocardia puris]RBO91345.1 hypothetical protein DFR74_10447 [Nocardia puris]
MGVVEIAVVVAAVVGVVGGCYECGASWINRDLDALLPALHDPRNCPRCIGQRCPPVPVAVYVGGVRWLTFPPIPTYSKWRESHADAENAG